MYLTQTLNHLALQIEPRPGQDYMRSSVELSDDGQDVVVRLDSQSIAGSAYMSLPLAEARWLCLGLVEQLFQVIEDFDDDVQERIVAVVRGRGEVSA